MDISIACISGKKVDKSLKINELTKHIRIIIISAYPKREFSQFAKDAGMDSYLLKIFDTYVFELSFKL